MADRLWQLKILVKLLRESARRKSNALGNWMLCMALLMAQFMQPLHGVPFCHNEYSVCNAALEIGGTHYVQDNIRTDDSPYCLCSDADACPKNWTTQHGNTLTWYHYERRDWVVQYHFCANVIGRSSKCSMNTETAITIQSDQSAWLPRLKHPLCHCPDHKYYLQSWRLNSSAQTWHYNYICYQRNCRYNEPCVKHYLDRGGSHTVGYFFICSCPYGQHCPINKEDQRVQSYESDGSDDQGPFITGICEDIPGWNPVDAYYREQLREPKDSS